MPPTGIPDGDVLIPRPPGKVHRLCPTGDGRSLQELMGMKEDDEFKEIMLYIRAKCKDHGIDRNVRYHLQDQNALLKVKEETIKEYPILGQLYEHAWPIVTFLKLDLRRRCRSKKGSTGGDPVPIQEISDDLLDSQVSEPPLPRTPAPSIRSDYSSVGATPQRARPTSVGHASSRSSSECAQTQTCGRPRSGTAQSTISKSQTSSRDHVASVTASSARSSNAVLGWIVSFDIPPADAQRITKLFASLGINDMAYLRAFARMQSRDTWLREMRENGELSEIHVRILRDMFERVATD